MKSIVIFTAFVLGATSGLTAQVNRGKQITERAKDKTINKTEQKVDEKIDGTLDKIFNGSIFKRKEKNNNSKDTNKRPPTSGDSTATDFKNYKNFEFVSGTNVLFFDDFSNNKLVNGIADGWRGNGRYAIEKMNGNTENWLNIKQGGGLHPLGLSVLPESFTLEMDVAVKPGVFNGTLDIRFLDAARNNQETLADPYFENASSISFSAITQTKNHGGSSVEWKDGNGQHKSLSKNEIYFTEWNGDTRPNARISILKQKERVSVYVNQLKIWDNVQLFSSTVKYYLSFHFGDFFVADPQFLLTNVRLATGTVTPAKDIETTGKWVTNAIYFDVNSAKIKPESWSVLHEIAKVIKTNNQPVSIIGHTDSDGDAKANLSLSAKRAASVKNALVKDFGIAAERLNTDGKGEEQPVEPNNTSSGKAKNRRVEFILIK